MRLAVFALFAVSVTGCLTHADHVRDVRTAFYNGNVTLANERLKAAIRKNDGDADILKLDTAMVQLAEGNVKEAETTLRNIRDQLDAKEGKDAGEEAKAMLLDDSQRAYAGEDYEKVMIRFMLALCNLFGDGGDAAAYALQVNQKQQQIIEQSRCTGADGRNLKERYKLVAAGAYLHAAIREETHTNYDDVARSLELVAKWQPSFASAKADLERAKSGRHSKPGHGVVYVFTFVGEGPLKEEHVEPVSQTSLFIADRLITALGKQSLPPTIAPIKVPLIPKRPKATASGNVAVRIDGVDAGTTATITDVGLMAAEQCEASLPETVARAVVRRVVKKGIVYGAKEALKTDKTQVASLALDLAGVAWEATESADTRCWSLLPDKIQVLRIELSTGAHELSLMPCYGWNLHQRGHVERLPIQVADGRNTYILANFNDGRLLGRVLTSSSK